MWWWQETVHNAKRRKSLCRANCCDSGLNPRPRSCLNFVINDRPAFLVWGITAHQEKRRDIAGCFSEESEGPGVNKKGRVCLPRGHLMESYGEVTWKLSLWLWGLQNLVWSFPRQGLNRNGPAGGSSFELRYKNNSQTHSVLPPLHCPTQFRGSISDQDWQMDLSQASSATVCSVFSFNDIYTG